MIITLAEAFDRIESDIARHSLALTAIGKLLPTDEDTGLCSLFDTLAVSADDVLHSLQLYRRWLKVDDGAPLASTEPHHPIDQASTRKAVNDGSE